MTILRGAVITIAGLGALLLAPAAAQAADYQVYRDAACTANAECGINYPRVGAGQKVTITNVSCYLRHAQGASVAAAQLVVQNSDNSRAFAVTLDLQLQSQVNIGDSNQLVWVSNDAIRAVANPGQRFRAYAQIRSGDTGNLGTVIQLSCGISGTSN